MVGEGETAETQPPATRSTGDGTERVGHVVDSTHLERAHGDDHDDAALATW